MYTHICVYIHIYIYTVICSRSEDALLNSLKMFSYCEQPLCLVNIFPLSSNLSEPIRINPEVYKV